VQFIVSFFDFDYLPDIQRRGQVPQSNLWIARDKKSSKLLLVLASTVILGSESRGTQDHILLSHDSGSRPTHVTRSEEQWLQLRCGRRENDAL
jgi:hypothetical protein